MKATDCPTIHDDEIKLCELCGKQAPVYGYDFCNKCLEEYGDDMWVTDDDELESESE